MAKNYRDNFDYSEAIANSTSKAERDRLLAERQNKIDAEGLTGRVADNSAVSTWTKGYRPYYVASASSASKAAQENAERVSSLYDAAEKARLERFEAARTRIRQQLDANLSSIDSDYASAVRQAGISARQSALRNEEKLALLRRDMAAQDADTLLLTALDEIAWTLNLRGGDVACTPVFLSFLLIGRERAVLCVQRQILSPEIERALAACGVELAPYADIYDRIAHLPAGTTLLADSASANSQNRWFFFISLIPHKSAIRRGAFAPLRRLCCCYLETRFFRVSTTTAAAASAALPSHSTI